MSDNKIKTPQDGNTNGMPHLQPDGQPYGGHNQQPQPGAYGPQGYPQAPFPYPPYAQQGGPFNQANWFAQPQGGYPQQQQQQYAQQQHYYAYAQPQPQQFAQPYMPTQQQPYAGGAAGYFNPYAVAYSQQQASQPQYAYAPNGYGIPQQQAPYATNFGAPATNAPRQQWHPQYGWVWLDEFGRLV